METTPVGAYNWVDMQTCTWLQSQNNRKMKPKGKNANTQPTKLHQGKGSKGHHVTLHLIVSLIRLLYLAYTFYDLFRQIYMSPISHMKLRPACKDKIYFNSKILFLFLKADPLEGKWFKS